MTAEDLYAALTANVAALYADAIDHDTFGARNGAIWDEIVALGLRDDVLRLWRAGVAS